MKYSVCFDLSQTAFSGGVGTYTRELASCLAKCEDLTIKWLFTSFRSHYQGNLKNVYSYPIPLSVMEPLMNSWRWLKIEKMVGKVDIYHSSDWVQAPTNAKKVTTYHDVIPLKYPEWSDAKIVKVHRRRLEIVEREIDMVIAVTETTKLDLMEYTKIPAEKITVIYEGINSRYKPQNIEDIKSFKARMGLPDRFILGIGGIGSRRNIENAREAVKEMPFLVTHKDIASISDEEMPLLYASAEMLLYPSYYEGFGLPILEAMAVGTPVVTSDRGAMKEIAGEAAVLADPDSVESIRKGIEEALDPSAKKMLIAKGFERAKVFSWEKCARETVLIYKELMK